MNNHRLMIKLTLTANLIIALLLATTGVAVGADGAITSLSATDAPAFGQTITINASFRADSKINNSNVYYEIIAPDGVTVVATHDTAAPALDTGDAFSDSWTTANTSFPSSGTYTLRACWSTGNAANCNIAQATTAFFSVPTLGMWLTLIGVALLGLFLWLRRGDFRRLKPQPTAAKTTDSTS